MKPIKLPPSSEFPALAAALEESKKKPAPVKPLNAAIEKIIREIIREAKANGDVGWGEEMMMSRVGIKAARLPEYPKGVNHRYHFAEAFREVVAKNRFGGFIYAEGGVL